MRAVSSTVALLAIVAAAIYSSRTFAADFPEGYVARLLSTARHEVVVDPTKIEQGKHVMVKFLDRAVYVYRRTDAEITRLRSIDSKSLVDADDSNIRAAIRAEYLSSISVVWARLRQFAKPIAQAKPYRSLDPRYLVIADWSPESGCALSVLHEGEKPKEDVRFHDPCTNARFDAAGRIFVGKLRTPNGERSARFNIAIPPYEILEDGQISLGVSGDREIPEVSLTPSEMYPDSRPTKILIAAAAHNDIDMARKALSDGASVNYFAIGEGCPINAAVIGGSLELVRMLVAHGAKPTDQTIPIAESLGRNDLIQYLREVFK